MEQLEKDRYRSFLAVMTYLIGFFVAGSILTMIIGKVISINTGVEYKDLIAASTKSLEDAKANKYGAILNGVSNFIIYFIMFASLMVICFNFLKSDIFKIKDNIALFIFVGVLMGVAFAIASVGLDKMTVSIVGNSSANQNSIEKVFYYKETKALMLIATILFAPVVEELVFRKSLFTLLKKYPAWVSIIASAFLFSAIHMFSTPINKWFLVIYIPYFLCGLALAGIYKGTKENIYASIFAHMLNNLIACLIIIL